MARLIYSGFTSLDGYVADENGNFDWAELDEKVHTHINDRERRVGSWHTPDADQQRDQLHSSRACGIRGS